MCPLPVETKKNKRTSAWTDGEWVPNCVEDEAGLSRQKAKTMLTCVKEIIKYLLLESGITMFLPYSANVIINLTWLGSVRVDLHTPRRS